MFSSVGKALCCNSCLIQAMILQKMELQISSSNNFRSIWLNEGINYKDAHEEFVPIQADLRQPVKLRNVQTLQITEEGVSKI